MRYADVAEAGWRWVLDQVRWDDDGPWIPESAPGPLNPDYRDGMHSGVGALALALADVRLTRDWTAEENRLAEAIGGRLRANTPLQTDCAYFDGLVSNIGVLIALGESAEAAVERLLDLATPDGWPQTVLQPPRFLPDTRINDLVLGTAGVLLGALWARRAGARRADELAAHAAAVLLDEAQTTPAGLSWPFVPVRFRTDDDVAMPNFSHGVAGIATALALAGAELGRPDVTDAARRGAEHLVTLADTRDGGFVVPHWIPPRDGYDPVTYTWCHGPAGTSLLFPALERAGTKIAGDEAETWRRRCLNSVRTSGIPQRRHPGFWDNDGRCCGTAGVGEVFLDSWLRTGNDDDLDFALHLADTLVDRAVREGQHAYWRFIEHRAEEPLLPPGVGWMQGAAGISAFLFRAARVANGDRAVVARMDTWWALERPA